MNEREENFSPFGSRNWICGKLKLMSLTRRV